MRIIRSKYILLPLIYFSLVFPFIRLPINAASVLAAWLISSDGVLKLRTSAYSKLEAYFQTGNGYIGDRVWIDLPGELTRPRKIEGNGPIKQIRLGKPHNGSTRLVIEFNSNININPSNLQLTGVSPTLWELPLVNFRNNEFISIGEGNVFKPSIKKHLATKRLEPFYRKLNPNALPEVQRERFLIIIDPGHGGVDTGAVGINGLKETNVVLDISKQISKFLKAKGVQVRLTRYTEVDIGLRDRVVIANRSKANAFISIHANASRGKRKEISGVETYFHSGYQGKNLAKKIQNELLTLPGGSPDRGVRQSRFYVIGKTNMPAALVEVGFVTGKLDAQLLSQANHRREIAFAISKGILTYLKETY